MRSQIDGLVLKFSRTSPWSFPGDWDLGSNTSGLWGRQSTHASPEHRGWACKTHFKDWTNSWFLSKVTCQFSKGRVPRKQCRDMLANIFATIQERRELFWRSLWYFHWSTENHPGNTSNPPVLYDIMFWNSWDQQFSCLLRILEAKIQLHRPQY